MLYLLLHVVAILSPGPVPCLCSSSARRRMRVAPLHARLRPQGAHQSWPSNHLWPTTALRGREQINCWCSHMFVRKDEPSVHCRVDVGTCSSSWPCTDAHAPRRWITSGFLSSSVSISPPALRLSCACNRSHMHIAPCIGETGRPYHVHDWNRGMESARKLQKKKR